MSEATLIWSGLILLFVLMGISAVFSAAETAVTSASKARLHRLARDGNTRAANVEKLLDDKETLIGSALLGNNLINTLAAGLASYVLGGLFGAKGVLYATGFVTAMLLIFAEVLPKTYAIIKPDRVALALVPFVGLVARLLGPVVGTVQRIVRMLLRLLGVNVDDRVSYLSSHEEVRGLIDLHAEEGSLDREHKAQLGSILDLDEVTLDEVMVHRKTVEMLDISEPPEVLVRAAVRSSFTRLPVYKDDPDNIIGVLHSKDLMRALAKRSAEPNTLNIEKIMSTPWFVPETTTLREQLNAFIARRSHFALVVDEYGTLQGLVTLEDILEEIVGDISDEHDMPAPQGVTVNADGHYTVEGKVPIRDLNRRFDWQLPDDTATTIAGLVIHEAQIIPVKGQSFVFFNFEFEVLERRRNQITMIKLRPLKHRALPEDVPA